MPVGFPDLKGLFDDEADIDDPLSVEPESVAFGAPHDTFDQHFKLLHHQLILLVILIFQVHVQ